MMKEEDMDPIQFTWRFGEMGIQFEWSGSEERDKDVWESVVFGFQMR